MAGTAGPFLGAGSTLSFTPTSGTATPVVLLTDITIPGYEAEFINVSSLGTTADANGVLWKIFLRAWADAGELEAEAIMDPTNFAAVFGIRGKPGTLTITLANGSIFAAPAELKSVGKIKLPREEESTYSFSFKLSGAPTFTA
jgi:hypothetical protein